MFYREKSSELFWSYFDDVLHREKPIFTKQTGCLAECEKGEKLTPYWRITFDFTARALEPEGKHPGLTVNKLFLYKEQYLDQNPQ